MKKLKGDIFITLWIAFGVTVILGFFIFSAIIGGDALNGYQENGQYFVTAHENVAQVSKATWIVSKVWGILFYIFIPLTPIVAFVISNIQEKIKRRKAEHTELKSQFLKKRLQISKDPEQCLINIKRKIAEKTGITKCIDLDESSAAFSGTEENYDLYVSVGVYKKGKKEHFSVYMDDHLEWDDFDYESQEEFEDSIVEFICEKINRTIKTITETKKHKYVRVTEYYLDKETNEWVLMYDEKMSWLIARPFITEDSVTEEIKEYHI